ncbi:MAG: FKBP-type peptidyl-prolyl cis-trans isomerase [bacterium]|nr:FKBP-type peptidyl-prolyl cis-trans isomerase [bacterium]
MHKYQFSILIAVFIGLSACGKYSKTESGLRFKFLKRGEKTTLPSIGDYLQCYYSITNSEDSVVYSNFNRTPDRILLVMPTHKGGDIMEALGILAEGDSAQFLINADSFFYKTRMEMSLPNYIKPGSDLKFIIKMDRKMNKYQVDSVINTEKIVRWNAEVENIIAYTKRKGLTMELDSSTGIRSQFHAKANADTAKFIHENSIVKFHFIGKLFDDTEFYNTYTMGQPQIIRVTREQFQPVGMFDMLLKMKAGEKATFILPYDLGFGAKGVDLMIPPFSTLVYEINILKVE